MNQPRKTMMKEKKNELRKQITAEKKKYQQDVRSCWSSLLFEKLEQNPAFLKANVILLYYSLPDEVETHSFIEKWSKKKRILLPVVKGDSLEIRPFEGNDSLCTGAYHIQEPSTPLFTNYNQIELAIVPGVGFDSHGNRLGRGKGYYDKLLPLLPSAYKIGVCFKYQVCETIPHDDYDQKMDEVWTESGKLPSNGHII